MASVGGAHGAGGKDPLLGNKIAGAVLGAMLIAMALNIGSGIIYTPKKPVVPGYDLPAPEANASAGASDQQAQADPLPVRLASADAAKGQSAAKKCLACHVFEKGGPNKIGPDLYGIVGRHKGGHEGFAYSAAMKAKGGEWTFDDLDQFLANPKGYVPGTIMAFAGISNPKERADVVKYLQTLSDSPVPLPQPAAAEAPAAPAGAPGPSQSQQPASPPMPGQRAEPGPAPLQAQPQPATTQTQPQAQQPGPTRPADPAQTAPPAEPKQ
ncbi:MAG: cytochrome c family protein [Enterovirga sp.]|nr:cytochrome c family protein [Enterovirga sp.]